MDKPVVLDTDAGRRFARLAANFSFKRVETDETLVVPNRQQMLVYQDLEIQAGADLVLNGDAEVVILGAV